MAIPRGELVEEGVPGFYHCWTNCDRDMWLLADEGGEIQQLILDRIRFLSEYFAIDILSYAIMDSHYHIVVFVSPLRVEEWSDEEVVRRWLTVYPGHRRPEVTPPTEAQIQEAVKDPAWVAERRKRLSSLSWFHAALNEFVARRVNDRLGGRGSLWEGRFASRRILDLPGRVAACVYTDLNPVRAAVAETPETSRFTSVYERAEALRDGVDESKLWLLPIDPKFGTKLRPSMGAFGPEQYVSLVDATGRRRRADKRGRIAPDLPPILERLGIDEDAWHREMFTSQREQRIFGSAVGSARSRAREAIRRGVRWIVRVLDVYAHDRDPPPEMLVSN